jgi:hypothetical protein
MMSEKVDEKDLKIAYAQLLLAGVNYGESSLDYLHYLNNMRNSLTLYFKDNPDISIDSNYGVMVSELNAKDLSYLITHISQLKSQMEIKSLNRFEEPMLSF